MADLLLEPETGAHEWNRTIDLLLTKEVLYRLSYVSGMLHRKVALLRDFLVAAPAEPAFAPAASAASRRVLRRSESICVFASQSDGAGEGNRTLVISLEN